MRTLGGSVGLAIAVVVLNSHVLGSPELTASLTYSEERSLLRSPLVVTTFTQEQQQLVSVAFAKAFAAQMRVATYVAAACFIASFFALQRNPPQRLTMPGTIEAATKDQERE